VKRFLIAACVAVVVLAAGATAYAWHELSSLGPFPRDGASAEVAVPATPRTVYRSVAERAGGDARRSGARYGCAEVVDASAARRFRCVVPGAGAGDRRYRVTVDRTSCWTARRAGERPTYGCLRRPAPAVD
jgi:hypothetical protein